jgi:hypothetical protein
MVRVGLDARQEREGAQLVLEGDGIRAGIARLDPLLADEFGVSRTDQPVPPRASV